MAVNLSQRVEWSKDEWVEWRWLAGAASGGTPEQLIAADPRQRVCHLEVVLFLVLLSLMRWWGRLNSSVGRLRF